MSRSRARLNFRVYCLITVLALVGGGMLIFSVSRPRPSLSGDPTANEERDRREQPRPSAARTEQDVSADDLAELNRVEDISKATDAQLGQLGALLSALPAHADEQLAGLVDASFSGWGLAAEPVVSCLP